ncbi:MAG: hypothetical protein ACFFFG_11105 [Candidatus Thorarchaeota archaeon]
MSETQSDRLRTVLMRIIEGFSDYFVSRVAATYNETPSKVNVRNISAERKLGTTGIHIVKVALESDLGEDEASIAVKIYEQKDQAAEVVKRINSLQQRITPYRNLGVSSAAVIFFSGSVVIMEGIPGDVFRDSKIPRPQKYRYAGKALAVFHGNKREKVWFDKYKLLLNRSLQSLPNIISNSGKITLRDRFNEVLPAVERVSVNSGAITFGDFHPGNVIFDIKLGRAPMIQTHLIDPEFLDMTSTDHERLEDICNFFAVETVDVYRQDPELRTLRLNLKSFLSGYKEFLALGQSSLAEMYPNDKNYIPINFHLALMVLMSILNIQGMPELFGGDQGLKKEILLRQELIERLLTWESFPD